MSTENGWLLITAGVVLAVVGMAMVWASAPRAERRGRAVHPLRGLSGALTGTAVAGGVITGMQWAVVSQTGPAVAWAVVLGLPAFLAGATVIRLLRVLCVAHGRRRLVRTARRERRNRR